MGVVKSPGKRTAQKTAHTPQPNIAADDKNKDIYFEKDFGDKKAKWATATYKDKNFKPDEINGGIKEVHETDNNKNNPFSKETNKPAVGDEKVAAAAGGAAAPAAAAAAPGADPAVTTAAPAAAPAAAGTSPGGDDGPDYQGDVKDSKMRLPKSAEKDDKRTPTIVKKPAGNPDINTDPTKGIFYNEPPPTPKLNIEPPPEPVKAEEKKPEPKKKAPKPKPNWPPIKIKKIYGKMTKSKLVWDSDSEAEDNDKYRNRNNKISTAKMYSNTTYGSMYYARMSIGSPP